jgi:hypothetical protein
MYDGSTSDWTQTEKIVADSGGPGDAFAFSLAATPTHMVAGANGVGGGQGAAFVFADQGGSFEQEARLVADDGAVGDDLGYAIAILDSTLIVGADRAAIHDHTQQGAAYVFAESGGAWTQTHKLIASDGQTNEFYGAFVALADQAALVGVPYATVNGNAVQGAGYFYQRDDVVTDRIFADGFDG